jgi:glycosyltransferase involved in cell wall biosynthesis
MISPKISIILPVYKSRDFLDNLFDCLQNQTLREIEIIFVNDGSPDDSASIIEERAKIDERILLLNQSNSGAASAVQKGVEYARGTYLMFLDADDWIDKNTCEEAYNVAIKEDADMVFWTFKKEYPNKTISANLVFNKNILFEANNIKWLKRRLFGLLGNELTQPFMNDAISSVWGKLYKRTIITKNNICFVSTNEIGSTDVLYNAQLIKFINKAVYLHSFFNHYRQDNPTSLTKNYQFTLFGKYLKLFELLHQELISYNGIERKEIEQAIFNRISCSLINIGLSITSSRIKEGHVKRINHFKEVLNNQVYINALTKFQVEYLPMYWKIFYYFCKRKWAILAYILSNIMSKLR